jgi:hypothetical protein
MIWMKYFTAWFLFGCVVKKYMLNFSPELEWTAHHWNIDIGTEWSRYAFRLLKQHYYCSMKLQRVTLTHSLMNSQRRWTRSYRERLPRWLTHLPHLPSYCGVGTPRTASNSRSWRTLREHLTLHSSDILGQPHPRATDLRPPAHRSTLSHLLPVLLTRLTGCHS